MSLINIIELKAPGYDFGSPVESSNLKVGLANAGPFDLRFGNLRKEKIIVGIIAQKEMVEKIIKWVERCKNGILGEPKILDSIDYNGFENIFRCKIFVDDKSIKQLDNLKIKKIINTENSNFARFKEILYLYDEALKSIYDSEFKPDILLCGISEEVERTCWSVKKFQTQQEKAALKHMKEINKTKQLSLFNELVEPIEEDLMYRDFRRALKAVAMKYKIPIQIVRDNLLLDLPTSQDPATKAWNFSVAFYYKSGGIPWRIKTHHPDTCFVGISFHHLRTNYQHSVYSCIAQAFTTRGEGFAIKGDSVPFEEFKDAFWKRTHLTNNQAINLGKKIINKFRLETGSLPQRIVLHKTSFFNEDEIDGFKQAFANIPNVEFISLRETSFRLLKQSDYPVTRGTLCILNNKNHYIYTTGYIPEFKTYPGPHIPTPVQIISAEENVDLIKSAEDILALTKMNWNSASNMNKQPITFMFSRMVGGIMSEFGSDDDEKMPSSMRFFI